MNFYLPLFSFRLESSISIATILSFLSTDSVSQLHTISINDFACDSNFTSSIFSEDSSAIYDIWNEIYNF